MPVEMRYLNEPVLQEIAKLYEDYILKHGCGGGVVVKMSLGDYTELIIEAMPIGACGQDRNFLKACASCGAP